MSSYNGTSPSYHIPPVLVISTSRITMIQPGDLVPIALAGRWISTLAILRFASAKDKDSRSFCVTRYSIAPSRSADTFSLAAKRCSPTSSSSLITLSGRPRRPRVDSSCEDLCSASQTRTTVRVTAWKDFRRLHFLPNVLFFCSTLNVLQCGSPQSFSQAPDIEFSAGWVTSDGTRCRDDCREAARRMLPLTETTKVSKLQLSKRLGRILDKSGLSAGTEPVMMQSPASATE